MAHSALEYLELFKSLLPKGKAWTRAIGSNIYNLFYGFSEELSRIESRAEDLASERDTRYATELLIDHETDLGLPDACSRSNTTIQERQEIVHARLTSLGRQDKQYFIDLAAVLGWTITVRENWPFKCGASASGDACGPYYNIFYWTIAIDITSKSLIQFKSGQSQSGDSILKIPTVENLECTMLRYKPAHTHLDFEYIGPGFSNAFDDSFDSAIGISDKTYFEGAFTQAFDEAFDIGLGGAFDFDAFDNSFDTPI